MLGPAALCPHALALAGSIAFRATRGALRRARPRSLPRSCLTRHLSSEPPESPRIDVSMRRFFVDPDEHSQDVSFDKGGEEIIPLDASMPDVENIDWGEFEKQFGLRDISEEDLEKEYAEMGLECDMEMVDEDRKPKRREETAFASKRKKQKGEKVYSDRIDDRAAFGPESISYVDSAEQASADAELTEKRSSSVFHKAAMGSVAEKSPSLIHSVAKDNARVKQRVERGAPALAFTDPDQFRQPVNHKRPGYERRAMSMESEMGKIAIDVLCEKRSDWYVEGADVERVLLSPNMRDLTVYYNMDAKSTRRPAAWWRRSHKRHAAAVRAALGSRLVIKYVPRVRFQKVGAARSKGLASSGGSELDALFDKIAAEREEQLRCRETMSA